MKLFKSESEAASGRAARTLETRLGAARASRDGAPEVFTFFPNVGRSIKLRAKTSTEAAEWVRVLSACCSGMVLEAIQQQQPLTPFSYGNIVQGLIWAADLHAHTRAQRWERQRAALQELGRQRQDQLAREQRVHRVAASREAMNALNERRAREMMRSMNDDLFTRWRDAARARVRLLNRGWTLQYGPRTMPEIAAYRAIRDLNWEAAQDSAVAGAPDELWAATETCKACAAQFQREHRELKIQLMGIAAQRSDGSSFTVVLQFSTEFQYAMRVDCPELDRGTGGGPSHPCPATVCTGAGRC
eukprot:m51a1_g6961 hypothetical protein (302) ;mRNA; r:79046-80588